MQTSTITSKGQTTIPIDIRRELSLNTGDRIAYVVEDNKVYLIKLEPFDHNYHQGLNNNLDEWNSEEDDEAYRDL